MERRNKIIKSSIMLLVLFSILAGLIYFSLNFTGDHKLGFFVSSKVEKKEITILLMGDSLMTETIWVEEFSEMLKEDYKFIDFEIIKSARPGEMSDNAASRIDKELKKYNPNILILAYGTNDVNVIKADNYKKNMESMIEKSLKQNVKVFINLIGPFEKTALKDRFVDYNFVLFELSETLDFEIMDILTPLSGDVEANLADHTHYSNRGSLIVAETVFEYISKYIEELDNEN